MNAVSCNKKYNKVWADEALKMQVMENASNRKWLAGFGGPGPSKKPSRMRIFTAEAPKVGNV